MLLVFGLPAIKRSGTGPRGLRGSAGYGVWVCIPDHGSAAAWWGIWGQRGERVKAAIDSWFGLGSREEEAGTGAGSAAHGDSGQR